MGTKRRYSVQEKPNLPQSGEIPISVGTVYLQDRGWTPFIFDGKVKWIDPLKPYDVSVTEPVAIDTQLRRDDAKDACRYSLIDTDR